MSACITIAAPSVANNVSPKSGAAQVAGMDRQVGPVSNLKRGPCHIDKLDSISVEVENRSDVPIHARYPDELAEPAWGTASPVFLPINFTSWSDLMSHRRWLPRATVRLLKSIDFRIKEWPLRFAREQHLYRENASLIAMSEFASPDTFCRCCTIGSGRGNFSHGVCHIWKLCPYCSHKKRLTILRKFLSKFRQGHWWFLTISPERLCNVNICTVDCIRAWWEACRYALCRLIDAGLIRGVFLFETISFHNYWPTAKGLPHIHAVVLADSMTSGITDDLKRVFGEYHGQSWSPKKRAWLEPARPEPIWANPSTRTYAINREHDFAATLSYLCNPVNLAEAYVRDWPQVAGSIRNSCQFNENAIEAFNAWCAAMHGRWGHQYFGALQHASAGFTGVKKAAREKRQHLRLIKGILDDCQMQRMATFRPDELSSPVEFCNEDVDQKELTRALNEPCIQ